MKYRPSKTSPRSFLQKAQHGAIGPITCTLILFCTAWELRAQPTDLTFQHLTTAQGLSDNRVRAICQDSRGFMWFGTPDGLNRFDGYSFTFYRNLSINSNSTILEDKHGSLWTIVDGGRLYRFDRLSDKFIPYSVGHRVLEICEDATGDIWVTTRGDGLAKYLRADDSFTTYRHDPENHQSLSNDTVYTIYEDREGTLWIGTNSGLDKFDRVKSIFEHRGPDLPTSVYTILEDRQGLLWVGANDGLYMLDKARKSFTHYQNKNRFWDIIENVFEDSKNELWIATESGIARFDRPSHRFTNYDHYLQDLPRYSTSAYRPIYEDRTGTLWTVAGSRLARFDRQKQDFVRSRADPRNPDALSDDGVSAIYEDRSGTLWFGTGDGGVDKLDRAMKPFVHVGQNPYDAIQLSGKDVTSLYVDKSEILWVATEFGLHRINNADGSQTFYRYRPEGYRGWGPFAVLQIAEDRSGRLWLATWGDGLTMFDKTTERYTRYQHDQTNPNSPSFNAISSICIEKSGIMWIGTMGGMLDRFDQTNGTFRHYQYDSIPWPGIPPANLGAVYRDKASLLWICTRGLGVFDPKSESFAYYRNDPTVQGSLSSNEVYTVFEDSQGETWIGTSSGLIRFDRAARTFSQVTVNDGPAESEHVGGILEDEGVLTVGQGRTRSLWLINSAGISKYTPSTGIMKHYGPSDGVPISAGYGGFTYCKNKNGEMYFGGANGYIRFHPDSIRDNPYVPPIVITAFRKFDKIVPLDSAITETHSIEMSYKENVFSFEFVALNYTSPEKNQYAYKLEGFDNDWIYCGTRRYATYTNLDGGRYIFRVKGSNNDGIWNEEGTSIAVIVTPPFWKTWWFRVFGFIAILLSVGGSIRYVEMKKLKRKIEQLENERALERERTRISQDMHDEVGANLTKIAIISELAMKNAGDADGMTKHLQNISQNSREVVDSIGAIVWAINPKNDKLDNLAGYLREYASDYFEMTSIHCRFDFPDKLPSHTLSSVVRRNIFLTVKEATHNIVKHSAATAVQIRLRLAGRQLEIGIEDNGKGFLMEDISRYGNGLINMRKRIESINGKFDIQSQPGGGTTISFIVPVAQGIPL